jgi:hypothetical protein
MNQGELTVAVAYSENEAWRREFLLGLYTLRRPEVLYLSSGRA